MSDFYENKNNNDINNNDRENNNFDIDNNNNNNNVPNDYNSGVNNSRQESCHERQENMASVHTQNSGYAEIFDGNKGDTTYVRDNNNENYNYYQFTNHSPDKSMDEIKSERREDKKKQKELLKDSRNDRASGLGVKRVLVLTVMFLFFGTMSGLGFLLTTHVGSEMLGKNVSHMSDNKTEVLETGKQMNTEGESSNKDTVQLQGYQVLNDVSEIVKKNKPAMVNISATTKTVLQDFFRGSYYQEVPVSGSGFIISEDSENYYIATNHHVIDNGQNLSVAFIDNSVAPAVVKGKDAYNDLAVISVSKQDISSETQNNIKLVEIGDSENLVEGQAVIAMGNALGYGQSTTVGVISALDRTIQTEDGMVMEHLIQTDAAINFGNSGGALIDAAGKVIGINSAKNGSEAVEGMGYAIPISKAEPIISNILQDDRKIVDEKKRGMLGVSGLNTGEDAKQSYGIPVGFYINEIKDGGGAKEAGIIKGDVIVAIDGFKVRTQRDIAERLQFFEVGEKVEVTIMRQIDGEYKELKKNVKIMPKDKALINQEEREKQQVEEQENKEAPDKFEQDYNREDIHPYEENDDYRERLDELLDEMLRRP